jgi:uncharacterized membrane protein YhaH (DUF805 family)
MDQPSTRAYLAFLFRSESGRIARKDWWLGTGLLAAILVIFELGWLQLAPYANRGLDDRALIDPGVLAVYSYALVFALAFLLCGISFFLLSIKRLRDLGQPTALAGLVPFAIFIASALHWLQPRVNEVMGRGWVWGMDALLLMVLIWTCYELGLKPAHSSSQS